MKTVLVTGATGFIGSHLVETMLSQGYAVRTLARPGSQPKNAASSHPHLHPFAAPLTVAGMTAAAEGCDTVYHLAGITRASSDAEFLWTNAEGTRAAAVGAQRNGSRLVYVSSLAAAGTGTVEHPRRVSDAPEPITAYGRSKLEGEIRVQEERDLTWSIVRPPGVYGPRDTDFLFAFQAANLGLFPVLGNPSRAYTLVLVDDLVAAIIACGESQSAVGKTYFAGNPQPVQWREILETIARLMGKPYKPIQLPDFALAAAAGAGELGKLIGRVGLINRSRQKDLQAPGWVCDVSDLDRDLGVKAQTSLETGFQRTLDWYRTAKWL